MKEDEASIRPLIDKYFEGLTTLKEEQGLREYFRKDIIPTEWEIYRPMFRFFALEREANETKSLPLPEKKSRKIYLRWAGVAAACVLLYAGLKFTFNGHQTQEISRAYINGKAYTNLELIQSEALKGLVNLSENNEAVLTVQIEAIEALEFLSE
jgi:hypothetical protein